MAEIHRSTRDSVPRIGVIVPYYGSLSELRDALATLLAQTCGDWQAVVVDDQSPERGAAQLVADLADPRIICVEHAVNRGLAAARNTAFQHLQAPLVFPLDSDDKVPPTGLEALWNVLSANPQAHCAIGKFQTFGLEEQVWPLPLQLPMAMLRAQSLPGAGVLMRRELVEVAGGWCEDEVFRNGNEDWDFWLAALSAGPVTAVHCGEVVYSYQRRAGSLSAGALPVAHWRTRLAMLQRHRALFDRHSAAVSFAQRGLAISAYACWQRGRRAEALRLVGHAWRLTFQPQRHLSALLGELDCRIR